MKIEKITYQQTFPTGNFMNQKLGMEIQVGDDEQLEYEEIFALAKEYCESSFKKLNPHVGEVVTYGDSNVVGEYSQNGNTIGSGIATTTQDPKEKRLDSIEDQIMSCTEKKVLESYKFIAKTNEKLQEAYDKKMEEFV